MSDIPQEKLLSAIVDAVPAMIAYWDARLVCHFANQAYLDWYGIAPETIIGSHLRDLMGAELFEQSLPHIEAALAGSSQCYERSMRRADGSLGYLLVNYIPNHASDGTVTGFHALVTDITQLKIAESQALLATSVFENTIEGIVVTDEVGTILSINRAFTEITGYSEHETIGRPTSFLKSNRHTPEFFAELWRDISTVGRWQGEIWNRRKNGELFLEWLTITRIKSWPDDPVRYVAIFNDITEIWKKNERIRHLAFHDSLTNLPNRALVLDRLEHQIAMAERDHQRIAVMFLDLDGFKEINDTMGHDAGDTALRHVAERLRGCVRRSDTVARFGGDEFVIVLYNPGDDEAIARTAAEIVAAINEPFPIGEERARVGISVGIATYPHDGHRAGALITHADTAMYAAKHAGKNTARVYSPEMTRTDSTLVVSR